MSNSSSSYHAPTAIPIEWEIQRGLTEHARYKCLGCSYTWSTLSALDQHRHSRYRRDTACSLESSRTELLNIPHQEFPTGYTRAKPLALHCMLRTFFPSCVSFIFRTNITFCPDPPLFPPILATTTQRTTLICPCTLWHPVGKCPTMGLHGPTCSCVFHEVP